MKKVYLFLATGFEEVEALTVVDILRRGGVDCKTVSVTGDYDVTSSHMVIVRADLLFDEADFSDGEMLVMPGGTCEADQTVQRGGKRSGSSVCSTNYIW